MQRDIKKVTCLQNHTMFTRCGEGKAELPPPPPPQAINEDAGPTSLIFIYFNIQYYALKINYVMGPLLPSFVTWMFLASTCMA